MFPVADAVELAGAWRGCELDSGFLGCVATFYPVFFWIALVVFWAVVVVAFVLWRGKRSI